MRPIFTKLLRTARGRFFAEQAGQSRRDPGAVGHTADPGDGRRRGLCARPCGAFQHGRRAGRGRPGGRRRKMSKAGQAVPPTATSSATTGKWIMPAAPTKLRRLAGWWPSNIFNANFAPRLPAARGPRQRPSSTSGQPGGGPDGVGQCAYTTFLRCRRPACSNSTRPEREYACRSSPAPPWSGARMLQIVGGAGAPADNTGSMTQTDSTAGTSKLSALATRLAII